MSQPMSHHTSPRTWITTASVAAALFLAPGVAWADGGCGTGFESWGCFKILLALLTAPALAVFALSYPLTVLGLHLKRRRRLLKHMLVGVSLLPSAYIATALSATLIMSWGELTGSSFVLGVTAGAALIQGGWAWCLLKLTTRPNRSAQRPPSSPPQ